MHAGLHVLIHLSSHFPLLFPITTQQTKHFGSAA